MALFVGPGVAVTDAPFDVPRRGLAAVWAGTGPPAPAGPPGAGGPPPTAPPGRSIPLGAGGVPKNAVVTAATLTLRGAPFGRRGLRDHVDLWGATVSDGGTVGGNPAKVIDLHGLRALSGIALAGAAGATPVQLQAWTGVAFDAQHPVPAAPAAGGNAALAFPQLLTQKLLVLLTGPVADADFVAHCTLECASFPLNVRFVLAAGQPGPLPETVDPLPFPTVPSPQTIFWTYTGELSGTVTSIDFSAQLNAFLEACPPVDGRCHPHLVPYSDSPGLLRLAPDAVDLSTNLVATVAFEGGRLDRAVSFSRQGERRTVPLAIRPQSDERVRVKEVRLQVSGRLAPDRLVPEASWLAEGDAVAARVSPVFTLAQPVRAPSVRAALLAAVELNLGRASPDARLVLEVRADAGGAPQAGPPLASAGVDLAPLPPGGTGWVPAALTPPVTLQPAQPAWLVLKAAQGEALWSGDGRAASARPEPVRYSRDGGASWTPHPFTGLHKVKRLRAPGEVLPGLRLRMLGQAAPVEPGPAAQAVLLAYPDPGAEAGGTAALELEAEAAGEVQVANAVVDYQIVT